MFLLAQDQIYTGYDYASIAGLFTVLGLFIATGYCIARYASRRGQAKASQGPGSDINTGAIGAGTTAHQRVAGPDDLQGTGTKDL